MSNFLNSLHDESAQSAEQKFETEAAADIPAEAPVEAAEKPAEAAPAAEAPAPVATEEAPAEAPAPVQEPLEEGQKVVSLKALQEERQKRQIMERRLAELEARLAQPPAPPQPEATQSDVPDPETDPIGYLKHIKADFERRKQEEAERQEEARLVSYAKAAAAQFQQANPDYDDAYQFLIRSRVTELQAIGTDPAEIPAILKNDELGLAVRARQLGRNPAEIVYGFAKARGYTAKTAAPAPAPTPAPPVPDMQKARQAVAASAAAGGKASTPAPLDVEAIVNLKGAAFDSAVDKLFYGNKDTSIFRR